MFKALSLEWSALSHSGSRKERNDDSWLAFASSPAGAETLRDSGSHSLKEHDLVFAVSDGMGGANAGDLASQLILQKMSEVIPETFKIAAKGFYPDCLDHLSNALESVHEHINAAGIGEKEGMAATLALGWFTVENLYIANAGDSRIYRSRDGELEQLSRDHCLAWNDWKRGAIGEVEYRNHPRRAALYQVIGGGHPTVSPHLATFPYQSGDRFLICSDGLIDGIWERHIKNALKENEIPAKAAELMLKRALENSGIDDVTLVVIHVRDAAEGTKS
ncbi:MAG: PP2C family serine/threonine-protein phosphatase [Akkermansiaceae bacterium]|nr:PP2C family serine/threonine-protein phosphatase [Akkermansiaceae bacterium]